MFQPAPAEARLEALLDEHRRAVFARTLRLTCGDSGWAEDVVQETFLRAWRHWEHLTPDYGPVRGWLMRVAHNLVMDEYRSARMRRGEMPLEGAEELETPELTDQVLTAYVVREALSRLPATHRRAIEATYLCDWTTEQAARRLNVPVGTVKSRVFYGLRMLRSVMDVPATTAAVTPVAA
ncbi:sigma-70 family RNA polymerase sigma factor [Streptomyces sp. CA-111067]|uniref:sigma-70 family RNA polymerase sigma factor n=1 Tax=Streptomyces sp. CA-111067 TaxID=3240046 RepID=UPI003D978183